MSSDIIDFDLIMFSKECLKNEELVNQFCRLEGIKRPDRISPVNKAIDEACGYDATKDFFDKFIEFIREFIYDPMIEKLENE